MPKKMGTNTKAEAARARKGATEAERREKESREKEEQYWKEAEGPKSKAARKREEEAEKRAEMTAKKAEARRLAEEEERELEKALKKPDKKASRVGVPVVVVPKVTEAELRRRREEEAEAARRRAEEAEKRKSRVKEEEEYERVVLVENKNREEVIEARSVEEAIAKLKVVGVVEELPVDKHPEKRMKAAFKAFEEAELPRLKEEKPGLTHTQYKDMIWKLWKKSPDNPLNRIAE